MVLSRRRLSLVLRFALPRILLGNVDGVDGFSFSLLEGRSERARRGGLVTESKSGRKGRHPEKERRRRKGEEGNAKEN
jgi:hypothetical protein